MYSVYCKSMKKKTLIFRFMCFRDREKRPEGFFLKGREREHIHIKMEDE